MTTLSALRNSVNYPLDDDKVIPLLITRGCNPDSEFTQTIGQSKEYRLAYADTLRFVVTMVNLNQGGSVTMPNANVLAGTANGIYREYGEPLIGEKGNEISTLTDGSSEW